MPAIAPHGFYAPPGEAPQLAGTPTTTPQPGWFDGPENYSGQHGTPLTPSDATAFAAPYRNGALPDPTVGGFTEQISLSRSFAAVNPGLATNLAHQPFTGQGNYDAVPTWNDELAVGGSGTPNVHGKSLLQGILTQIGGYNPPGPASALSYAAALATPKSVSSGGQVIP